MIADAAMVDLPSDHPLLDAQSIVADLPSPLGEMISPPWLKDLLSIDNSPFPPPSPDLRTAVRDCLRFGGFKPAGRSKPSSEYLARAAGEGSLSSINPVVDIGNVVSLHTGLPLSVVDGGKAQPPLSIKIAPPGSKYVFNASGQEIDISGLVCLFDADGPCANPVKDAQRTKTDGMTRNVQVLFWGVNAFSEKTRMASGWARELLKKTGCKIR